MKTLIHQSEGEQLPGDLRHLPFTRTIDLFITNPSLNFKQYTRERIVFTGVVVEVNACMRNGRQI